MICFRRVEAPAVWSAETLATAVAGWQGWRVRHRDL
jgi:hypothetical protein